MSSEVEIVAKEGRCWVIRRRTGPWSCEYNRNSFYDYEYWNGSWSLASFIDRYATEYPSQNAAMTAFVIAKLYEQT